MWNLTEMIQKNLKKQKQRFWNQIYVYQGRNMGGGGGEEKKKGGEIDIYTIHYCI